MVSSEKVTVRNLFSEWSLEEFRSELQMTSSNIEITYQKYVSILVVSTASWDLDHFSLLEKFPGGANQVHGAPKAFLNFQEFFELFDAFHGVIGMFGCSWYQMKGLWKLIIEKQLEIAYFGWFFFWIWYFVSKIVKLYY